MAVLSHYRPFQNISGSRPVVPVDLHLAAGEVNTTTRSEPLFTSPELISVTIKTCRIGLNVFRPVSVCIKFPFPVAQISFIQMCTVI
jgi:hypothetical protein